MSALDEIDALIEQKRAELEALVQARNVVAGVLGSSSVATGPLLLGDGEESPPRAKAERNGRIAAIAKSGEGKRRQRSAAFKLKVLKEIDQEVKKGGSQATVLKKYDLSPSAGSRWRAQKESGALNPSDGGLEEPSLESAPSLEEGTDLVDEDQEDEEPAVIEKPEPPPDPDTEPDVLDLFHGDERSDDTDEALAEEATAPAPEAAARRPFRKPSPETSERYKKWFDSQ